MGDNIKKMSNIIVHSGIMHTEEMKIILYKLGNNLTVENAKYIINYMDLQPKEYAVLINREYRIDGFHLIDNLYKKHFIKGDDYVFGLFFSILEGFINRDLAISTIQLIMELINKHNMKKNDQVCPCPNDSVQSIGKKLHAFHQITGQQVKNKDQCAICNETYPGNCAIIGIGVKLFWVICGDCFSSGDAKKCLIKYFVDKKIIPLLWIKEDTKLAFYCDHVFGFYNGFLDFDIIAITCENPKGEYFINLSFRDSNGKIQKRRVSVENVFTNNPQFYENLVNCENILGNELINIGYNDLSEELRKEFRDIDSNVKGETTILPPAWAPDKSII
nr:uncharacterized protein LOC124815525 [Hydra vulgaris]